MKICFCTSFPIKRCFHQTVLTYIPTAILLFSLPFQIYLSNNSRFAIAEFWALLVIGLHTTYYNHPIQCHPSHPQSLFNPFHLGGGGQICPHPAQTRIPVKINGWKFWWFLYIPKCMSGMIETTFHDWKTFRLVRGSLSWSKRLISIRGTLTNGAKVASER